MGEAVVGLSTTITIIVVTALVVVSGGGRPEMGRCQPGRVVISWSTSAVITAGQRKERGVKAMGRLVCLFWGVSSGGSGGVSD